MVRQCGIGENLLLQISNRGLISDKKQMEQMCGKRDMIGVYLFEESTTYALNSFESTKFLLETESKRILAKRMRYKLKILP